jgi:polygalacturonase
MGSTSPRRPRPGPQNAGRGSGAAAFPLLPPIIAAALLAAAPSASAWKVVSVTDFGAVGDNATDNTAAFRAALLAVSGPGGGEVIVPAPGIFKTAPFNLTSDNLLTVQGTIWGMENATLFPLVPALPSYDCPDGMPGPRHHPLVWAVNASNVTIAGSGVINGAGPYWWYCGSPPKHCYAIDRPHILELHNVSGAEVTGITLRNSAFWTFRPWFSRDVHIHDMEIDNPWCNEGGMNTDGIDVDSSVNVLIERNVINCGDDHVTVISGAGEAGRAFGMPSRNVTVRDNRLGTGMGLSVGSSVSGGVEDVLFTGNVMAEGMHDWGLGAHLKTRTSYGGYVRNVAWVDNLFINVTNLGMQIETDYQSSGNCDSSNCTLIQDIVFRNLTFNRLGCPGSFGCYAQRPCINVTFENIWANATCPWGCHNVSSGSAVNVTPPGLAEACGF